MKSFKLIFISFLFLVLINPLFSQVEYFNKIYTQNLASAAYAVIEKDSFYYVGGTLLGSTKSFYSQVYISKINKQGDLISSKSWGDCNKNHIIGWTTPMITTSDNGFVMIGGIQDTSSLWPAFLMKFDANCDSVWERKFYDTISTYIYNYIAFHSIKETYDRGFIIVGEIKATHQYDNDIFLLKTDSLGNTEWYKTYGYIATIDRGFSVIQTPDSGYVISGDSWHAGMEYATDAYLVKTDKYGNVIWDKFLGGQYSDHLAYVALSFDSNYIVGYSYAYEENPPVNAKHTISVIKITPSKQILWGKIYKVRLENNITNIYELNDHNIVIVGMSTVADTINNTGGFRGFIMKLNEYGDSLWYRDYSYLKNPVDGDHHYLWDIKPTSDGGFIACGSYKNYYIPTNEAAWIVKTDSLGCDTPGCNTIGINEYPDLNISDIIVYPNPAYQYINIEIKKSCFKPVYFELFDCYGRRVKEQKITKPTQTISLEGINDGMYFYRVRSKSRVLAKDKLLVIR